MKKRHALLAAGALALGIFGIKHEAWQDDGKAHSQTINLSQTMTGQGPTQSLDAKSVARAKLESEYVESYRLFQKVYLDAGVARKKASEAHTDARNEIYSQMHDSASDLAQFALQNRNLIPAQTLQVVNDFLKTVESFNTTDDTPELDVKNIPLSDIRNMSDADLRDERTMFRELTEDLEYRLNKEDIDMQNRFQVHLGRFMRLSEQALSSLAQAQVSEQIRPFFLQKVAAAHKSYAGVAEEYAGLP